MPGRFDESKHPRKGGRFADKPGAGDDAPPKRRHAGMAAQAAADQLHALRRDRRAGKLSPKEFRRRAEAARDNLRRTMRGGGEPDKAKFVGATVGREVQQHAERVKHEIAGYVGGVPEELTADAGQKDKKPYDVKVVGAAKGGKDHDLEVKSMSVGGKQAISVHDDALFRKVNHARSTGNPFHTIVVDDRATFRGGENAGNFSGNRIYYKRGNGRFALSKMQRVADPSELRGLILAPDNKLPAAARGSLPPPPPVSQLRARAEAASESRKSRDKARKERNRDKLRAQARERRELAKA